MRFTLRKCLKTFALLTLCVSLAHLAAQTPSAGAAGASFSASALPRMVRFSGTANDVNGARLSGTVGITFSLYLEQSGGTPLWLETQNVQADANGRYSVLLGATKPEGLPAELFTTEQAHWVGVRVSGQAEQPRVLLVSAPYALKAGDAETLGGLPPSAFVLAAPANGAALANTTAPASGQSSPSAATNVTTTGGAIGYVPVFNAASTVVDSVVYQTGTGTTTKIGINTTTPLTTLDVKGAATIRGILSLPVTGNATATAGKSSQPLSLAASAYNSSTPAAVNQTFRWQAEAANNNTATPSGTLNLLFGEGTAVPTETGLHFASSGQITFATGQTFPGVVQLDAANAFVGNQTVTGTIAATTGSGNAVSGSSTLGDGVFGSSGSNIGAGVYGTGITGVQGASSVTNGTAYGVLGTAASPSGVGVEGQSTASGGGIGVFGTAAAASGFGVEGTNTSGNGTGVYGTAGHFGVQGIATATTGSTVGVFGSGVDGLQGSGTLHGVYAAATGSGSYGVYATAPAYGLYGNGTGAGSIGAYGTTVDAAGFGVEGTNTSGNGTGVYGTAAHFGVQGIATGSGNTVGVFGSGVDGLQGAGTLHGVYAATNAAGTYGVYASAPGSGSIGVYSTADGYGIYGNGTASDAVGVYGTAPQYGLAGVSTNAGVGVYGSGTDGVQGSGSSFGVYGSTGAGIAGTSGVFQSSSLLGSEGPWSLATCTSGFCPAYNVNPQAGVRADTDYDGDFAGTYTPALLATADASAGAVILNNSSGAPTLYAYNYGSGGGTFGVSPDAVRAGGPLGTCALTGGGDAACTGLLKSVVATKGSAGAQQVETYAVQSAENWFEDAGSGQLVNGTGRVNLESVFGQTVNTGVEYHVFLTPDGDCKGLYVSAKSAAGFEVRELGGGGSSIAFEYRIMAKRVGYENVRLANVTERYKRQQEQARKMQRPARSSAQAQSGPTQSGPKMPPLPSTVGQSTLMMPTAPVAPPASPRPQPVTSKPIAAPPVRGGVQPSGVQAK